MWPTLPVVNIRQQSPYSVVWQFFALIQTLDWRRRDRSSDPGCGGRKGLGFGDRIKARGPDQRRPEKYVKRHEVILRLRNHFPSRLNWESLVCFPRGQVIVLRILIQVPLMLKNLFKVVNRSARNYIFARKRPDIQYQDRSNEANVRQFRLLCMVGTLGSDVG